MLLFAEHHQVHSAMHGGADRGSLALHPAFWQFHHRHAGTIAASGAAPLPYSASPLLRRQIRGSTSWLCFSHWLRLFSMICAVIPVSRAISARIVRFGGLIRTQGDGATAERRDWANGWWSIGPPGGRVRPSRLLSGTWGDGLSRVTRWVDQAGKRVRGLQRNTGTLIRAVSKT
jgi:hypothetical protein